MSRDFNNLDTFPKILRNNALIYKGKPSVREKEYGIWQTLTWDVFYKRALILAKGLKDTGLKRGEKIAIIGDNRPNLYLSIAAAQILGAVPVPCYQDSVADELQYILEHAEVKIAIVENQEQVDKLLEIKDKLPLLKSIFYDDPRGLDNYQKTDALALDNILNLDNEADISLDEDIDITTKDDISIMLYTSGTTGRPKGVLLSYYNIISVTSVACELENTSFNDEVVAYLPMAWVGDNIFCVAQSYISGFCINCPESRDTLTTDMREIGPTYYFAPPRVWEGMLTQLMVRMQDAAKIKLWAFNYFMNVAKKWGNDILDKKKVPLLSRLLYALGYFFVYGPLKNMLGLTKVRIAYTAGESISSELFDFYRSIGINLKQLYGQTEASVFLTMQGDDEVMSDTVGKPIKGVELKIADSGEVLYRSVGAFKEYYKNPKATSETKDKEGWIATGDAGYIDKNSGQLRIIDRASDVGKTKSGLMFAPKYVENKLKFFPNILEAVLFGSGQEKCVAFLNIDLSAVGNWAERNNINYASYQELASNSQVMNIMKEHVEDVNKALAKDSMMSGCQIHRFLILHKELDPDDGEITRTRKVRRGFVSDKYEDLIDALYKGAKQVSTKTEVTYEDGKKGYLEATLNIVDAQTFVLQSKSDAA